MLVNNNRKMFSQSLWLHIAGKYLICWVLFFSLIQRTKEDETPSVNSTTSDTTHDNSDELIAAVLVPGVLLIIILIVIIIVLMIIIVKLCQREYQHVQIVPTSKHTSSEFIEVTTVTSEN